MLSVEKPPVPDPPSQPLKHTSSESHHNHETPLPEVDLSNPLPPPPPHQHPLPKFSIRDYVFTSRSKDIKTNWPFSLKNLQLCLKHGVKDVLPPFQPLDAVRNQYFRSSCTVENQDIVRNNNNNNNNNNNICIDGEPSGPDDHDHAELLDSSFHNTRPQLNQKLAADVVCIHTTTSCRSGSGEENDQFPSTTTSVCQSEIEDHSLPTNRSTTSPLQTDTSLEASVEVEPTAARPRVAHKTQTTTRTSAKKCRLIVKFGSQSDRSSTEDIASNCTNPSETMASKICPVCKTFSSSSNTTLNAHIDQCLSVESTPKWTVDSKLTRHRIKPRKTKLMVDIYATASHCTLEDLDRRNGSNWATVASLPIQPSEKSEMPVEDTKQRVSPAPSDHHTRADVGAVYVDSNGIKFRILSKSDDSPSVSKVIEHLRPRKPLKGGKGSKFMSTRKKKRRAYKYNKYLKLVQSKKLFSSKSRSSPILGGQGKQYGAEGSFEEGRNMQKQVNPCNSGTLRKWACSKRTGIAKKFSNKVSRQQVKCKWQVSENPRVESDQSRLDQDDGKELMDLSGNLDSSPENSDRLEKVFSEAHTHQNGEQSSGIKRAKSSLYGVTIRGSVESSLTPMKKNARRLRKDRTSVNDYHMLKPPKSTTICTPVPGTIDNFDLPPSISPKLSRSFHSSRSRAMKISSARGVPSSRQAPVTESKSDAANKFSSVKNSQVQLMTEIDEVVVPWDSEANRRYDFHRNFAANQSGRDDISSETSLCRSTGLEVRQNIGVLRIAGRKEAIVPESSQLPSQCYLHDDVENIDSSTLDKVDDVGPTCEDLQCSMDEVVPQQSHKRAVRETLASWHKSADPEIHKLGSRSKILSNSLPYKGSLCDVEVLTGPAEPSFVGGQDTFYSEQLGNGMLVQNVNIGEEQESEVGPGSCFPEVDPILIPGPPGSFLPSPRDMVSEDFQGNSSLTTSRVQSSQDQHDFIDGDSSDSPVSATSTISNSPASRDDHKHSELLPSVGPHSVQDKIRSSHSGGSVDSSIENFTAVPQTTNTAAERLAFDKEKFKVNKIPLSFKSDDEPCCCQRKERVSQGVLLNYQESQLLKRRTMSSVIIENQMSCNLNNRPNNVESQSDVFSPNGCHASKSEQVVLPIVNSSASQNILRSSADAATKFSGRGECDSMSPSSNSILRLMGKNLMVVNRDQDESMPLGRAQPQSQVNHLTSPFPTFSGISPSSSIQNQVYHPFHPNFHRGSVILGQDPHNAERQCVDARLSNSMRGHTNPRTSQILCQGAASSFQNQNMDSGFVAPMELCEFKADYSVATPQKKFKYGSNPTGHLERVITIPDHQHKNVITAANHIKEIITIDDVPETEADLAGDIVKYSRGLGENHIISSGIVIPSYNTKCETPFYSCQSDHDQSIHLESSLVHSSGFHSLPSRQANSSPVRWSCPSDGSGMLQHNPYIAASSSRGHLRSTLCSCQSLM
ncbi:hypothetical protein PanWU01x14_245670 [Parasponia andersonii]|uniref:Uncharacterized protein n=1 Tax=Parasponia andersonii TaxID=3476 RepID=A0A2P5BEK9_PARAD|nr:hypothetical protein PanWU01x14_245670 [Parasponia andersonii]